MQRHLKKSLKRPVLLLKKTYIHILMILISIHLGTYLPIGNIDFITGRLNKKLPNVSYIHLRSQSRVRCSYIKSRTRDIRDKRGFEYPKFLSTLIHRRRPGFLLNTYPKVFAGEEGEKSESQGFVQMLDALAYLSFYFPLFSLVSSLIHLVIASCCCYCNCHYHLVLLFQL